jgi:putative ABC transport system permease protein
MAASRSADASRRRYFLRMLFKSLIIRKKRVAIAFLSLTIGAAVITALASVYFDIAIKMSRELRAYGANFFIGPKAAMGQRIIDESRFEAVLDRIPADKLLGASPYLYGIVRLDLGKVVMSGVRFSGLKRLSPFWQVEGQWIGVDFDEKHIMIGRGLAKKMELTVGDTVNLIHRETGFHKPLIVRGIVETGQAEDEQIIVNLSLAQKALGLEGKINHAFFSVLTQGFDLNRFAAQTEKKFDGLDAKSLRKVSYSDGKVLGKIKGLMALVAVVILVTTTLCVMTTLMAMVVERTREIGLMKALGADDKGIVLQFLGETAVIGLTGVAAGLLTGFGLAQVLGQAVFNASIALRWMVLPLTLFICLAAALLAAALPVKMAVNVVPAQVLKGE